MTPVAFPYIEPTFKTALNEVLAPALSTGTPGVVGGVSVEFYNCELHFNIDLVRAPSRLPRIGIVGSRSNVIADEKCIDQTGNLPLGYVRRIEVFRSLYVSVPKSLQIQVPPYSSPVKRLIGWEDVDKIWSQVHAVFATKHRDFIDRNIFRPAITPTPVPAVDTEYFILYGVLNCEVRVPFVRG